MLVALSRGAGRICSGSCLRLLRAESRVGPSGADAGAALIKRCMTRRGTARTGARLVRRGPCNNSKQRNCPARPRKSLTEFWNAHAELERSGWLRIPVLYTTLQLEERNGQFWKTWYPAVSRRCESRVAGRGTSL